MDSRNCSDCDSEGEFEVCRRGGACCRTDSGSLPFDPAAIEKVILTLSDQFDFKVIFSDSRVTGAALVTGGLALAGTLIGSHCGGRVGAAVGGAVGGACGLGIVAITMRDIWNDVKGQLSELFDIVYDYLAGLGIDDYKKAVKFLAAHHSDTQLALIIVQVASDVLGKKILSSLTAAI